jgi:tetratricopeptide (TPR) repeat protein
MDQIKAFVGHSFSEADKDIVNAFLEYFDQLKGVVPHFSWEHAYAAEPKDLADKVMTIIADKNVFIGICTKNEVAAPEGAFKSTFFDRDMRTISVASLKAKTSDWIIQEIGLAKGKGMEIVLLVEEGLRDPGGLQDNIEYISFTRGNPQKAFGKVLEMIRALSPKPATSPLASEPPPSGPDPEVPEADDSNLAPKPEWSLENYKHAAFRALYREQDAALATLSGAFLASVFNTGGNAIAEWESDIEFWKIFFGKGGNLDKLRTLVSQYPDNHELLSNLARGFAYYDDHEEAAKIFLEAAICATGAEAISLRARAATEFALARQYTKADTLLEQLRSGAGNATRTLTAIQEIGESRKDEDTQIAALERKVELTPDDFDARFSLAYKHSHIGNDDLALHHYLRVPSDRRNAMVWNNIGVQLDHFKMPNKAVNAYRAAEEKGETLSMSNLAYKLMRAGFLKEAQEIFDRARQIEGYHKNVDTGLAQLKETPDGEEKILNETLDKSHQKLSFYRALGDAIAKPKCASLDGQWRGKEATLTCTVAADTFKANGTYEVKGAGIGGMLFGGIQQTTKYEIEYECKLIGRTLQGSVRRKQEGHSAATGLLVGDGKTKVLMYLSEDCRSIDIMENPHSMYPTFHSLNAL